MKVIVFGASGMVGQGVLRACLADAAVMTARYPDAMKRMNAAKATGRLAAIEEELLSSFTRWEELLEVEKAAGEK